MTNTYFQNSIYLINPKSDFPTYYGAEVLEAYGYKQGTLIADLVIPTVAAFVPDDFGVSICDETINPIDFNTDANFIGITGKVNQKCRMIEIANQFRAKGKIVIMGGSYASLSPDKVRDYCDVLVRGEIEDIAEGLFNDLRRGDFKTEYEGTKPSLENSPIPRWDLYPNHRAAVGCIQTSRGCPYRCEFCDVIVYLGRKQRQKPIDRILQELEVVYQHGYRTVFFSDDNFTIDRRHAKGLLTALKRWNQAHAEDPVRFRTQVSVDAANDDELLQLCAEAGLDQVFIGIESPNPDSMREVKKSQNVGIEMVQKIRKFYEYGIVLQCGMMVGFDADQKNIFQLQYDMATQSLGPYFTLGILVAPDATPLYARLKKENRLLEEAHAEAGSPWESNIIPKNMSKTELNHGVEWLCSKLYAPENFAFRFLGMLDLLDRSNHPLFNQKSQPIPTNHIMIDMVSVAMKVRKMGADEKAMWKAISERITEKPKCQELFVTMLFFYAQLRYLYEKGGVWNPALSQLNSPWEQESFLPPFTGKNFDLNSLPASP